MNVQFYLPCIPQKTKKNTTANNFTTADYHCLLINKEKSLAKISAVKPCPLPAKVTKNVKEKSTHTLIIKKNMWHQYQNYLNKKIQVLWNQKRLLAQFFGQRDKKFWNDRSCMKDYKIKNSKWGNFSCKNFLANAILGKSYCLVRFNVNYQKLNK